MKIIELLTKIANGEEVPKKIRYKNKSYIYSNECRGYYLGTNPERFETFAEFRLVKRISNGNMLNDEVEIIEEDKKIEKLENEKQFYSYRKYADIKNDIDKILYIIKGLNLTEEKIDNLNNKINEIIDKINGGTNGE